MLWKLSLGGAVHGGLPCGTHHGDADAGLASPDTATPESQHGSASIDGGLGYISKINELTFAFVLHLLHSIFGWFETHVAHDIPVDHDVEAMSPYFDVLAKDDPLWDAPEHVEFGEDGCSEEDVCGLFEAGLSEDGDVSDPVDTISVDGGQETSGRHPICQNWQVTMVHVYAVRFKDVFELVDEGCPCRLDAQHIKNLGDIVGVGFDRIYFGMWEAGFQIGTLSFKYNVLATLFLLFVELLLGVGSHNNFLGSFNSFYTLDSTDKYISDSLINLMEIFEHSHLFIFVFGKYFLDVL